MFRKTLLAMLATIALPAASFAQAQPTQPSQEAPVDRGYDVQTPRHDAVDAVEKPVTQSLNTGEAANAAASTSAAASTQAQYDADMAQYRAAVQANRREAMRDDMRYARQQRAYADAMAAWRQQVWECEHGKMKACKYPTPDPAAFY